MKSSTKTLSLEDTQFLKLTFLFVLLACFFFLSGCVQQKPVQSFSSDIYMDEPASGGLPVPSSPVSPDTIIQKQSFETKKQLTKLSKNEIVLQPDFSEQDVTLFSRLDPLPVYQDALKMEGSGSGKASENAEQLQLRPQAVAETAHRFGVQLGFAERYRDIIKTCYAQKMNLDRLFPFYTLLIEKGKVVPPVIVNAESSLELVDPSVMKSTRSAWRILQPARFVTVPPSWRDYYVLPAESLNVEIPHKVMLPRDGKEKALWKEKLAEGYEQGKDFAFRHFETSNNRLMQEFVGLIQYHVLANQNMISIPGVKSGHYGIRVGKDTLELDQETFTLTAPSEFQKSENWKNK